MTDDELTAKVARIKALRDEQERLLDTILYYRWLAARGVPPELINGVKMVPVSPRVQREVRAYYESAGLDTAELAEAHGRAAMPGRAFISYRLTDGREIVLAAPPFAADVVHNRPRI
jgi:hypothetical protein